MRNCFSLCVRRSTGWRAYAAHSEGREQGVGLPSLHLSPRRDTTLGSSHPFSNSLKLVRCAK